MNAPLPLLKGTLDTVVLKALAETPMHGFEITTWLEARAGGPLDVTDSALYQALYRMEERGLLEAEWGTSDHNRRARYYRLTGAGRRHLKEETARLVRFTQALHRILLARGKA